jgi:hypothetical protein
MSALVACGGGGGGGGSTPPVQPTQQQFAGTVAFGAPVVGAIVRATCEGGSATSAPTDALGNFQLGVPGNLPCRFEVKTAQGLSMQSIALTSGQINLTPLTDLGVKMAHDDPANLPKVKASLLTNLPSWGVDLDSDPFTTVFRADGTGHDKAIEQFVTIANRAAPLTSEGATLAPVTALNVQIGSDCQGTTKCYPIEAALNQIPDEDIKEVADAFLKELNVEVTFGIGGVLMGPNNLDGAEEAAVKKGVKYIAALYFRYAAPRIKKGMLQCFASNPQCARTLGFKLASEFKKDATINLFANAKNVLKSGKVEFILNVFADVLLDRLEENLVEWAVKDESVIGGLGKSLMVGTIMFPTRSAIKAVITVMSHPQTVGRAMLANSAVMTSLALKSEVDVLAEYVWKDIELGMQLWSINQGIAESEARIREMSAVLDDYEEAKRASQNLLAAWLRGGMVGDAGIEQYLNLRRTSLGWLFAVSPYLKEMQNRRYDDLTTRYALYPSICRSPNGAACLAALGLDEPIGVKELSAIQTARSQPVNGSLIVSGASIGMVRIHAGTSAAAGDAYCYIDLAHSAGIKSFNFTGNWTNENGKACASLLPATGHSATIVFRVEARDARNNLANGGSAPYVSTLYLAGGSNHAPVLNFFAVNNTTTTNIKGSFTIADADGDMITSLRVHIGRSAGASECTIDVGGAYGTLQAVGGKSFAGDCASIMTYSGTYYAKVEAKDGQGSQAAVVSTTFTYAPVSINRAPVVSDFHVNNTSTSTISGGFSISDLDGDKVTNLRIHIGRSAGASECTIDVGGSYTTLQSAGSKSFSGDCAGIMNYSGTYYAKVEAKDGQGSQAAVVNTTFAYAPVQINRAPVVSGFYVNNTSTSSISGGFSISDLDGDKITNLRIHVGRSAGASECTIDVGGSYTTLQSAGSKSFSGDCAGIMNYSGTYYAKVEAKDGQGSQAAVVNTTFAYAPVSINRAPVVSGFYVNNTSTSSISGGFSISDLDGDKVTNLRIHIGRSAGASECTIDVGGSYTTLQSAGSKSFSGDCAGIMNYSGTYHAKVEARDGQGNQAAVVSTTFAYAPVTANRAPEVSAFYVNNTSTGTINGGFSISDADGDKVTNVRVHIGRSAGASECTIDVGGSYTTLQSAGSKSFSGDCAGIMNYSGTYHAKVEARDSRGSQAAVMNTTFTRF